MSVDWQSFKSCLDRSNVNAAYIDDEGSEIPIENECEFEEAVKFAKKYGGNQLHFILKVKDTKKSERFLAGKDKTEISFMTRPKDKINMDDQICQCDCKNEVPPLWFTDYMKKFKHKLLEEVKCNIQDAIKPTLKEIKKLKSNKEAEKIGCQTQFSNQEKICSTLGKDVKISQTEHQSSNDSAKQVGVSYKHANSKKLLVKDSSNLSREQRDLKLLKKIEKLSLSKLQSLESRLEEMRCDTKYLLDEKKKRSEKKSHAKSKLQNENFHFNQTLKNGTITTQDTQTVVKPGENFTLLLGISNNGEIPWQNPTLKCFPPKGFTLEKEIKLSPLKAQISCFVIVTGKASKKVGAHVIQFELRDEDFLLSIYDCSVIITTESSMPSEKVVKKVKNKEISEDAVKEIEKRLEGINLQHSLSRFPNTASPTTVEKKTEGIDAFVNLGGGGGFEKNIKTNEKNEEVHIYTQSSSNNCLDSSKEAHSKIEKGTEALSDEKCKSMDLIDLESNSDSELSFLCISEEEEEEEINSENFVLLPSPPQEKVQVKVKTVKDQATEMNLPPVCEESTFSTNLKEPLIAVTSKCEGKEKVLRKEKEIKKNKKFFPRSRSPLPDDRKSSRTKKLKSFKSSEYQFKATDLTRPALSIYVPYSNINNNGRTFTFTGERKREHKTSTSPPSTKENKVPTTDSLGRTIYAVSSRGYCLPVETLIKDDKETSNGNNVKSTSVNILPDALMSGASNMASLAINTAKSVISNLQSALVKEGTEMSKPASEPKKVKSLSMEALYKLYEMGFTDLQVNRNLLLQQDNDLSKVIEELLLLEQSRSRY